MPMHKQREEQKVISYKTCNGILLTLAFPQGAFKECLTARMEETRLKFARDGKYEVLTVRCSVMD